MTEVIIKETKGSYEIIVDGHNENHDVCHAISTLVAALEGALLNLFPKEYEYNEGDGHCKIEAPKRAEQAVLMFIIGVMRLKANFDKFIQIEVNV